MLLRYTFIGLIGMLAVLEISAAPSPMPPKQNAHRYQYQEQQDAGDIRTPRPTKASRALVQEWQERQRKEAGFEIGQSSTPLGEYHDLHSQYPPHSYPQEQQQQQFTVDHNYHPSYQQQNQDYYTHPSQFDPSSQFQDYNQPYPSSSTLNHPIPGEFNQYHDWNVEDFPDPVPMDDYDMPISFDTGGEKQKGKQQQQQQQNEMNQDGVRNPSLIWRMMGPDNQRTFMNSLLTLFPNGEVSTLASMCDQRLTMPIFKQLVIFKAEENEAGKVALLGSDNDGIAETDEIPGDDTLRYFRKLGKPEMSDLWNAIKVGNFIPSEAYLYLKDAFQERLTEKKFNMIMSKRPELIQQALLSIVQNWPPPPKPKPLVPQKRKQRTPWAKKMTEEQAEIFLWKIMNVMGWGKPHTLRKISEYNITPEQGLAFLDITEAQIKAWLS
jgi:hypothetical protein